MWLLRLKRLMLEREVLIGLFILGIGVMFADLLYDLGLHMYAAIVRGISLLSLLTLFVLEIFLHRRRQPLPVPVLFTEKTGRDAARDMFNSFVRDAKLNSAVKMLASLSSFQSNDLIIHLNRPNPRDSHDMKDWINAWDELLREWEQEIDQRLAGEKLTVDGRCYHILPHIVLPLAFALGASVNLRRSLVLYHNQNERYYGVLDLRDPRKIFDFPDESVPQPAIMPENIDTLPKVDKLILHIIISARHKLDFQAHPDHPNAASAALVYNFDRDPEANWLPLVQGIFQKVNPLITQYRQVEICLISPSAIAFALGMAFSRAPHITICHFFADKQYRAVFQLAEIERRLPFS